MPHGRLKTKQNKKQLVSLSCRCIDLGLRHDTIREVLLSEGLLAAALPLLRPDTGKGPVNMLMNALEALHATLPGEAEAAQ